MTETLLACQAAGSGTCACTSYDECRFRGMKGWLRVKPDHDGASRGDCMLRVITCKTCLASRSTGWRRAKCTSRQSAPLGARSGCSGSPSSGAAPTPHGTAHGGPAAAGCACPSPADPGHLVSVCRLAAQRTQRYWHPPEAHLQLMLCFIRVIASYSMPFRSSRGHAIWWPSCAMVHISGAPVHNGCQGASQWPH